MESILPDPAPEHGGLRLENASFERLRESLCEVHADWGFDRPPAGRFDAEIRVGRMGDMGITDVTLGFGLSGRRTKRQIGSIGDAFYGVILMLEGGQCLEQGGNEIDLNPGDISVWDASRPASFRSNGPVRQVSVLIPREKLKLYASGIDDVCARRICSRSGLGLLLASHLRALTQVLQVADDETLAGASQATLDMVGAALRPERAGDFKSTLHQTMQGRIRDYILDHLRDPSLSPGKIADAFRITPRYLHKLFEGTGFTVSEWMLNRRLAACRSALEDPALGHLTVTEIAFGWGFGNAAYFSRAYRRHFNMSPSETRALRRNADG